MIHELKTHPEPFNGVVVGDKTFEFRKNDRGFNLGDTLLLQEFNPLVVCDSHSGYTGISVLVEVSHILYGPAYGIPEGYCCMSIKKL